MIIEKPHINYIQRCIRSIYSEWGTYFFLYLISFIIFKTKSINLLLIIPLILLLFFCIYIIKECYTFINKVELRDDIIFIDFFKKDTQKKMYINIKYTKVEIYGSALGCWHSAYMMIYYKSKPIIKQYSILSWHLEDMRMIEKEIKRAKKEYLEEQNGLYK